MSCLQGLADKHPRTAFWQVHKRSTACRGARTGAAKARNRNKKQGAMKCVISVKH